MVTAHRHAIAARPRRTNTRVDRTNPAPFRTRRDGAGRLADPLVAAPTMLAGLAMQSRRTWRPSGVLPTGILPMGILLVSRAAASPRDRAPPKDESSALHSMYCQSLHMAYVIRDRSACTSRSISNARSLVANWVPGQYEGGLTAQFSRRRRALGHGLQASPDHRPHRWRAKHFCVGAILQHMPNGPGIVGHRMLQRQTPVGVDLPAFTLGDPARDLR